ncbi:hypothetical protein DBR30_18615 [Aeromonas sp. HMWF017]|nr:hypothetical protein DBR30_18615 [Aeromonas sp. HMWF017]
MGRISWLMMRGGIVPEITRRAVPAARQATANRAYRTLYSGAIFRIMADLRNDDFFQIVRGA